MVQPGDIAVKEDLARALNRTGEAIARPRRGYRVVEVRSNKVRQSYALNRIGIPATLARVARFHEIAKLAGSVLNLSLHNLDGRRSS